MTRRQTARARRPGNGGAPFEVGAAAFDAASGRMRKAAVAIDALAPAPAPAARLHALPARTGLQDLPGLRCRRRIERLGHLEVWGPPRDPSARP